MSRDLSRAERVHAVARGLRADLRSTDEPFRIEVVELGDLRSHFDIQRAAAAAAGYSVPEPLATAISVRHGCSGLTLVFLTEGEFATQLVDNLEQLQDMVAEITTDQWPPCPRHNHPLEPVPHGMLVSWVCPCTPEIFTELGGLAELDAQ